jgi:hypothetical protein
MNPSSNYMVLDPKISSCVESLTVIYGRLQSEVEGSNS